MECIRDNYYGQTRVFFRIHIPISGSSSEHEHKTNQALKIQQIHQIKRALTHIEYFITRFTAYSLSDCLSDAGLGDQKRDRGNRVGGMLDCLLMIRVCRYKAAVRDKQPVTQGCPQPLSRDTYHSIRRQYQVFDKPV